MNDTPVSDLTTLLLSMEPSLSNDKFAFSMLRDEAIPEGLNWIALIQEDEGMTIIAKEDELTRNDLAITYESAKITLTIHSDLEAVGLTAAVSKALADKGISCNVVAAYYHDHLFVPWDKRHEALEALAALQN